MKKIDYFIIIFVFLFSSFILYLNINYINKIEKSTNNSKVVISRYGEIEKILDLDKDGVYELKMYDESNTLEIKDKKAKIIHSNCPDQLCKYQKEIQNNSEMIVCLPHGLIIEIKSESEIKDENGGIDTIAN